jgi:hypothetical protein
MVNLVKYKYIGKTGIELYPQQGSIPDRVWKRKELQNYIANKHPHGYVGHLNRRKVSDRAVMKYFKDAKKTDKFITERFLMNAEGRHMMDSFHGKSESQIYRAMEERFGKVKKKK